MSYATFSHYKTQRDTIAYYIMAISECPRALCLFAMWKMLELLTSYPQLQV